LIKRSSNVLNVEHCWLCAKWNASAWNASAKSSAPYPSLDRGFHVIEAPGLSGSAEATDYLVQGRFRERGFRLQQNAILDIDHHQILARFPTMSGAKSLGDDHLPFTRKSGGFHRAVPEVRIW
jgi:hypothetical protein